MSTDSSSDDPSTKDRTLCCFSKLDLRKSFNISIALLGHHFNDSIAKYIYYYYYYVTYFSDRIKHRASLLFRFVSFD